MSLEPQNEMSESDMMIRKFLKQVGVTASQELSGALAKAVKSGAVAAGTKFSVTAKIEISELQFLHVVTSTLQAPESNG